ncbi:TolC family outer membrane protein [Pararoseomonas indoligenes]|uniref:TolC family outer membrane protein n=1 Tax=Roseomonas indoligenes TaxID=2820811 RepID=A0A940MVL6_9PROT|nr:TolC family outer membrane protein [Pararoseomonas indoligenes]MBP0492816.1 TolC family outer membrane protein [Pararoseomonas indoligenes]
MTRSHVPCRQKPAAGARGRRTGGWLAPALGLAVLAAPVVARGQTLQEALAQTYANNPTLATARAQLRVVDENVPQALAGWRPTVSVSGSVGYGDGSYRQRSQTAFGQRIGVTTDVERTIGSVQATVTQPLYRGGRTVAATRRAENQVMAQRARLLATEQQVLQDAVTGYVNVIRFQEEVRLNLNNAQVLQRQLDATNERFRVGEITRTDVAQAESRLAGARASRADAEGQLQNSRAVFQRVIGAAPTRLTAPQPLSPAARTNQDAAQVAALNNPAVVAALFDEAAARDFVDVQIGALLPQASLQGQALRSDNQTLPGVRTTGEQIVATVTVPIYQGGAEYAVVRQARQDAARLRQVVDDQRRTASAQAVQAWETLQSTRATVDSVRAQIRASEIALDGVQREAVVGSRTTLDVLNAEQELLNARVSLVRALANVVTASHSLAQAVGRLTARDLRLPVALYDTEAYYKAVRDRWAGLGDYSAPQPVQQ